MADDLPRRLDDPQADLRHHQVSFVVYDTSKRAVWQTPWGREETTAALSLVQAPKEFGEPVTQRKCFKPAFKVRLVLQYRGQLQMPVKLEACALGEPLVQQLLGLHADGSRSTRLPSLVHQQELENSLISFCIQAQEGQAIALDNGMYEHVEDQEFSELRFGKSSRMHKRWILFSCKIGVDTLYLLYKIPTIVLSRKTDQLEKARSILLRRTFSEQLSDVDCSNRPEINLQPQPQSPLETVRRWIIKNYEAACLSRPLKQHDLLCLQAQALSPEHQLGETDIELHESYKKFQQWFLMCLRSLKQEEDLWCSSVPMKICDLIVDRSASEDILMEEPVGTFLVRLCSEPGAFSISVKVQDSIHGEVQHYLVDALDLRCQRLGTWISLHDSAVYLLDIPSGKRIPKSSIFSANVLLPMYLEFGSSSDPRLSCPGSLVSGPAQSGCTSLLKHNVYPNLAFRKEHQPNNPRCGTAVHHGSQQKHSHLPAKPTKEQLMRLAAVCGFDVSQGLDPIFHSKLNGGSSLERDSELAKYCGIDSNQLSEPSKANTISGLLFDMPNKKSLNKNRDHSPRIDNVEHVMKRSRLGSY